MIDLSVITEYRDEYDPGLEKIGFNIENTLFGSVDAEILYAMVRRYKPNRIIEIGSGNSTFVSMAALDANALEGRGGSIVSIDPDPYLTLDPRVDHRRMRLEDAPRELFRLFSHDFVFIDSSHKWAPGNDVDILYHEILPALPIGVFVHVHDVFLPDVYPPQWDGRGYDEQDHLQRLLDGGGWKILVASHRLSPKTMKAMFASYTPDRWPGSFWMVRV